ncbi:MAG: hypothetical protein V3V10_06805 [Planctomycetota bacterium]
MPVHSTAVIPCDGHQCPLPALTISGNLDTIEKALNIARQHGWLIENDHAYCPRCAKVFKAEQRRLRRKRA